MPEFVNRSEWGARASKGGPGGLTRDRVEGVALHWPAWRSPLKTRAAVESALRSWQRYHMDTLGWSDIGYQEAVDQEGNVYRLRGLRNQSGANGGSDVNERFGAILLVLAPGEEPSKAMVAAVRRRIGVHRDHFPKSTRIVGHQDVRPEPTACPGPAVMRMIGQGTFEPTVAEPPPSRVERAREHMGDAEEAMATAIRLLDETPEERAAAHDAGRALKGIRSLLLNLLERMPKA